MRLKQSDKDIALVAADLLEKGHPSYRIAKYCLRRKMDLSQVYKLSQKLPSFDPDGSVLKWFHHLSERPELSDNWMRFGAQLREEIDHYGKSNQS